MRARSDRQEAVRVRMGGAASRMAVSARRWWTKAGVATTLCACAVAASPPAAADNDAIGYPQFAGSADPVPAEPVRHRTRGMMRAIYDAERHGTDFWMDRLLARRGEDPAGDWLLTRGRALFMKTHDPETIGFGGQVAYWESIDNRDAYA